GLAASECGLFTPQIVAAGLNISNMTNQLANLDSVSTDGFDMNAQYEFEVGNVLITTELNGTYVKENTFYPGAGGADDRGSIPRIKAVFNTQVSWETWDFIARGRYIHGLDDPRYDGTDNTFGYSDVPSHTEWDLRARYNWDQYAAVLGVNNVFDNDPEYIFASGNNTDLFMYSPIGRYFFLRFSADL
ncbi:MAG: hypothetical protein ACI96M_003807, partial [Candidatus Azotimanducaceae bacterium]